MLPVDVQNLYRFYYLDGYEFCQHLGTFTSREKAVEGAKRDADYGAAASLTAPNVLFGTRPPSGIWLRDTHPYTVYLSETVSLTFEETP